MKRARSRLRSEPDDMDVRDFDRLLARLPENLPISDAYHGYDGSYPPPGPWYTSRRQRMVSWFRGQATTGEGAYSRMIPNLSAKRAYNRLLNAGSLLWINEALGNDPDRIQQAADAASQEKEYRKRCRIVREYLPWSDVISLANRRKPRNLFTGLLRGYSRL